MEIEQIENDILTETPRGALVRYWEDVNVGDELDVITKGPISLTDEIAFIAAGADVIKIEPPQGEMSRRRDLACMCDIRIASEKAKFAESFVRLGIIPGDGGAWLLPRIVEMSRAAELAFTGDTIDAQQALAWNLVSRVVPHEELMAAARELASRIAQHASHGLRLTKRLMREAIHARLDTVLELSATFQAICHKTPDHSEAVDAFLEKRAPRFD